MMNNNDQLSVIMKTAMKAKSMLPTGRIEKMLITLEMLLMTILNAKNNINIMQMTAGLTFIVKVILVFINMMKTDVIAIMTQRKITDSIIRSHCYTMLRELFSQHVN